MSESAQTTVEKEQAESPLLFQREGVPALKAQLFKKFFPGEKLLDI